jgi:hypothetical protein
MRDPEDVEAELVEISALPDDDMKLQSIIVWCATHPDEVPLAIHLLLSGRKHPAASADTESVK